MKKLCGSEAFALLPVKNGVIFCTQRPTEDGKAIVAYNKFSYETYTVSPATKSLFMHEKFGPAFKEIDSCIDNYITCLSLILPNKTTLVVQQSGEAILFSPKGNIIKKFNFLYNKEVPQDITFFDNDIWAVYKKNNCIVKYNWSNMQQVMRIGDLEGKAFDAPVSICGARDELFICCANNRHIVICDPVAFSVSDYAELSEGLYKYIRSGSLEIILLDSGVYII